MSRSVAGSYDNEAVAIFGLVLTFYLFLRTLRNGSLLWSLLTSLSYFYTAASWGGYVLVPNLMAIFFLCLLVAGSVIRLSICCICALESLSVCAQESRCAGLGRL